MILRPKLLSEIPKLVRMMPFEVKSVVLAGRHLNEGTHVLSEKQHKEWEKEGAVVIRIPKEWTPEHICAKVRKGGFGIFSLFSLVADTPSDSNIIQALRKAGINVPVLNFHATPYSEDSTNSLSIHTSRNSCIPELPNNLKVSRKSGIEPTELLVEYHYKGTPRGSSKTRDYASDFYLNIIFENFRHISPRYFLHPTINQAAIREFEEKHSPNFKRIFAHLAKHGLTD